jgi:CBS-domain-containing membrane protein
MPGNTTVAEVMTTDVVTLRGDQTVAEAADVLADRRIGAAPVLDDDGRMVGLLRDEDLIVSEARLHVPTYISLGGLGDIVIPRSLHRFEHELKKAVGSTVADVMATEYDWVGPEATLEDVASLMHDRDTTHVPVLDADAKLLGIVARSDLVRFLARTT